LQTARIQAVRKNTFYTLQPIFTGTNITGYFVDVLKTGAFANGDPNMAVAGGLTIFNGTGSGAPNEAGLVAKLSFAVNPGADQPSFNARGLPCIVNGNACAQTVGSGYITFVSKPVLTGNAPWAAVAINPSGHIQVWTSDNNGNWIQRD
jgi:hypothetical protein